MRAYIVGGWKNKLPKEGVLLLRKDGSLVTAKNGDMFSERELAEESIIALKNLGLLIEVNVDLGIRENEVRGERGVQTTLMRWLR